MMVAAVMAMVTVFMAEGVAMVTATAMVAMATPPTGAVAAMVDAVKTTIN